MKTLIEDLKKVMNSDIENKDKYMEMLINGFLREKQTEQLPIYGVSQRSELLSQYNNFVNMQYHNVGLDDADITDFTDWLNCG